MVACSGWSPRHSVFASLGRLTEQWQDELYRRFHLPFDILTNDKLEVASKHEKFSHMLVRSRPVSASSGPRWKTMYLILLAEFPFTR
jgi:hypothetical protein